MESLDRQPGDPTQPQAESPFLSQAGADGLDQQTILGADIINSFMDKVRTARELMPKAKNNNWRLQSLPFFDKTGDKTNQPIPEKAPYVEFVASGFAALDPETVDKIELLGKVGEAENKFLIYIKNHKRPIAMVTGGFFLAAIATGFSVINNTRRKG